MTLIQVDQLAVYAGEQCLLNPISLQLHAGERLTILGQTGSGKSLLAQAIMGNLPRALQTRGQLTLFGEQNTRQQLRQRWGRQLSMLPQEPWNALNPLMKAQSQLAETYHKVAGDSALAAHARAEDTLAQQGLAESRHKRVDQLSGGMAQRVAIACAVAGGAQVILADEPTKGLDISRRDQVIDQLLAQTYAGALITITHDVGVAKRIGGKLMVIKAGELVESGDSDSIFARPQHPFTQALINADPQTWLVQSRPNITERSPLLETRGLAIQRGSQVLARDINFKLHTGEVIGVVGDSGCGKSTLGDTLLGLNPAADGELIYHGARNNHRWQKIYQDPTAAISHAVTLETLLNDLLKRHRIHKERVKPLMERLGLASSLLQRHANAISGGELQRFCLMRALLLDPLFLFADEPTSRLDPITQQEVSQLLVEVARDTGCAVMLVSHDPHLIAKRCDRVIQLTA